ncbi:MAG: hypothetical protein AB8B50_14880, partial [Pirellulaceae bacterium]
MSQLLLYYQRPEPATWVFISSFLLFSFYFVFHRFFCVRNLDLVLLLLLAPGLMMVYEGRRQQISEALDVSTSSLAKPTKPTASGPEWPRPMARTSLNAHPRESLFPPAVDASRVQLVAIAKAQEQPEASDALSELETLSTNESSNSVEQSAPQNAYPAPKLPRWKPQDLEFYGFVALLVACSFL